MREVWKFEVHFSGTPVSMPRGAEFLHVAAIAGKMWVWALVDPAAPREQRQIGYFPTGRPIPEGFEYVGTGLADGGVFVWHVFAAPEGSP